MSNQGRDAQQKADAQTFIVTKRIIEKHSTGYNMTENTANIGFEREIWNAACILRGNIDAAEYKQVVLGLIFLKYISDKFEDRYQELIREGNGFEEDRDEYTLCNVFFVPENARWAKIAEAAHTPEIGKTIDDAMIWMGRSSKTSPAAA